MRVERVSLARLHTLSDFKRRRKVPPSGHFTAPGNYFFYYVTEYCYANVNCGVRFNEVIF